MEELQSFLENEGLTVSSDPMKGRCLIANKVFSPGDVIIREEPYACAPKRFTSTSDPVCQGCFKSSKSNLHKCSACQVVWYCGIECQRFDWKMHKIECQAISRLDNNWRNSVTPEIRLMIVPTTAIDNYKLVQKLVAHLSSISEEKLLLYTREAEIVKLMLQWPDINLSETIENFSKLSCNAHTITDSKMGPLGIGLYLVVSMINHSCSPNSVLVFEGREAVIRAVQHVQKGKYSCNQCGVARSKKDSAQFLRKLGSIMDKAAMEALSVHKKAEKLLMEACCSSSYSLMKMQNIVLQSFDEFLDLKFLVQEPQDYVKLGDMQKALEYCRLTMPTYQRTYTGLHPLLGLRYYTCGKLEWKNGNKEIAVEFLEKAVDILQYTHGTETQFMKELLVNSEKARIGGPCEF
ncbi:hypothetical protein COLO4_38232 [Corchorus olitorius]|uniref:Zinc finger, MYND-type n=1 Tax=Corchorus olitorius TaxID=93759 RepID=A0A1R3FWF9_9ROSI|nr:hypothetical protein COLO4_38232 [Corchorus olitorius]